MKTKKMLKGELFLTLVLINIRTKEIIAEAPSYPQRVKVWTLKNKDNIIFGSIFIINLTIKTLIDAWLTPFLMQKHGFLNCFIITNIIYGLLGVICVFIYDSLKKDWLMIEALKKYQLEGGHLRHKNKLIKFILKKNTKHEFVLDGLLFFKHPGLFVIKKRDGIAQYNGFAGKNIMLLYLTYLLIMNIYWNSMVYLSISIWDPIIGILKELFFWYIFTLNMTPFF